MRPHQAGDPVGISLCRPHLHATLLVLREQALPSQAFALGSRPGHCQSQRALRAAGARTPTTRPFLLTHVSVSPAHSGHQHQRTPPAAPCGWRTPRWPEGQARSHPGPCGAAVRASLRTGPGLAGRVTGGIRRGPPPLPGAPARCCGCRETLCSVESTHVSVLKCFGGFQGLAASLCPCHVSVVIFAARDTQPTGCLAARPPCPSMVGAGSAAW